MATTAQDITFIIPGQAQPAGAATRGSSKASVRVGTQRGAGDAVRVTARPGDDVVVLTIANGPTLYLHPEDARDLMRAQSAGGTRGAVNAASEHEVVVSPQLGWPGLEAGATRGATRGWMGQAVLSAFEVVTGLAKDPAKLAAAAVTKKVDGAVEAGVYELSPDVLPALKGSGRKRDAVPAAADGGALLVLIHGTFVDTMHTFGKLWALHPQTVRELFTHYADRVYALDHPTMGASPITNALTLVRAMPAGARLHLVTHSRGGLVAEVLARACGGKPPTADELALFAGAERSQQRADLIALSKEAIAKGLKIERVVRVACPARGTLLASKRFDAYLSVLKWGLELGGVPVAPQLVDFLHEVARRRAKPDELPGIEAMMPESPLVKWLNGGSDTIPGDLRVIAGDMEGDSIGSWVKTLLSDAFYWTDNDLVVQTRSMYGGAPRAASAAGAGASFLLDRGAKVSHFNYFANERTVKAIMSALFEPAPNDFAVIGPLSWAGQDASGTRAARAVARSRGADASAAADRPAVFVLPGILGSNLKLDGKRIWLGFRFINGLKKLAWDPATAARIEPDGPIGLVYDDLIERLADTHEVIPFAYDWRRPVEDEARRLATAVDAALAARNVSQQPVRLLAHSMGGLVARTMRLEKPETWQRMMARDGGRLLMLGTPNGGSWAPMQTLSGDDNFGNALVAFGSLFDNGGTRKMMAAMPGFIQLQASLLDPNLGLDKATTWQKLADDDMAALRDRSLWHDEGSQRTIYEWGAPPQDVLDQAVKLRRRLDAQADALGADAQKMLLVVGHAAFTPAGFTQTSEGLEYLDTPDDGDGRVPLQSALLPGVRTWKVDAEHGKLPDEASAFAAYIELLTTGQTAQLEAYVPAAPGTRGAGGAAAAVAAMVRSRPSRGLQSSSPPASEAEVLGLARAGAESRRGRGKSTALRVSVLNGDLKFIAQPLLVGHYRSIALTGTEWVVDGLVGHAMSKSLAAGLYPDATGSHQIFGNLRKDPENPFVMARPAAVIVAGLGDEGKLRASELVYTVRQAVLAYAQRVAEQGGAAQFELAATLLGSGGKGVSPGSAAQLIAQGAFEASQKLQQGDWPQLSRLILVEFYLDRASDAWRSLQVQAIATPNQLELVGLVASGDGALRRSLDSSYRGAAYDLISALTGAADKNGQPCIEYVLDTRRARTEVRAVQAQGTLLKELVAKASNDENRDSQIGRTLFKLLVPVEMEPFLGGTTEMLIELDGGSAVIPWELLDTDAPAQSGGDPRPWAIRSKLLRKLRTKEFRAQVSDANADDSVLVIGEPRTDNPAYPPLPGARAEAIAVVTRLTSGADGIPAAKLRSLVSGDDDARTVINALFERPYRVVHVAGHGELGGKGGVVLSGNTFLGAAEIKAMRVVPELVFLNCCHLAGRDASSTLQPYDRATFAANIAEALIEVGVRCVIAAGWAVEDGPAEKFATTFYAVLLRGERFIDAVAAAREAAWRDNPQGNTWAAYQCYGDPGWTWSRGGADAQRPAAPVGDEFIGVSSPVALTLALETLAIRSRFGPAKAEVQRDKLRFLESKFAPEWGGMGAVAEAFGLAWGQAKDSAKAIDWYRVAVNSADGSASFRAAEQLGNELARCGEKLKDEPAARAMIEAGIDQLARLVALQTTVERESLLGSAWKRLVLLESRSGKDVASMKALEKMVTHYANAEAIACRAQADNLYYPAKNGISAELRLAFLSGRAPRLTEARLSAVRESLDKAATERPDFWSVVGQTELSLLEALAQRRLAGSAPGLLHAFRELKARVPSSSGWDSVYTEARFTLEPYEQVANGGEQRAACEILAGLKALAAA
jgi:CHAT domain-containing protein